MAIRTKTYIAAEWDGDIDLINELRKWNTSEYWALHFLDAHELNSSRDSSLNCSIKHSLAEKLACSKTFVLIVGTNTRTARAGRCSYCGDYAAGRYCRRGYRIDNRSYVEYECDYAVRNGLNIVVLYNYLTVNRDKCPEAVRWTGNHLPALRWGSDGSIRWNYQAIKEALGC